MIIDDNAQDIARIESCLKDVFINNVLNLQSTTRFTSSCDLNCIDLFILDIDIPEHTGYEVSNMIYEKQPNAKIVFCTNHDDLVYSTFPFSPFYFVRKSHLEQDMKLMAEKFRKKLEFKSTSLS